MNRFVKTMYLLFPSQTLLLAQQLPAPRGPPLSLRPRRHVTWRGSGRSGVKPPTQRRVHVYPRCPPHAAPHATRQHATSTRRHVIHTSPSSDVRCTRQWWGETAETGGGGGRDEQWDQSGGGGEHGGGRGHRKWRHWDCQRVDPPAGQSDQGAGVKVEGKTEQCGHHDGVQQECGGEEDQGQTTDVQTHFRHALRHRGETTRQQGRRGLSLRNIRFETNPWPFQISLAKMF